MNTLFVVSVGYCRLGVEALAVPILKLFDPKSQVLSIAVPYLRVHLLGLVQLEMYRVAIAGLQGLRHIGLFAAFWIGFALFEAFSNYLVVVQLRWRVLGSAIASATRNTLFAIGACGVYFFWGTGKRRDAGSLVGMCRPSHGEWMLFIFDSALLFMAGSASTTQTVLFSAFTSRLGTSDAAAMVVVKRIIGYFTVISQAAVVITTAISASNLTQQTLHTEAVHEISDAEEEDGKQPEEAAEKARSNVPFRHKRFLCVSIMLLVAVLVVGFKMNARRIYSLFSTDPSILQLMGEQDALMCVLCVCTIANGISSGCCYGAHRFRELSMVSFGALILVFGPVLVFGLVREQGLSLGYLLTANIAYVGTCVCGYAAIALFLGPRYVECSSQLEQSANVRNSLLHNHSFTTT